MQRFTGNMLLLEKGSLPSQIQEHYDQGYYRVTKSWLRPGGWREVRGEEGVFDVERDPRTIL